MDYHIGGLCSPILFNVMINDLSSGIDGLSFKRSFYVGDGALCVRKTSQCHIY